MLVEVSAHRMLVEQKTSLISRKISFWTTNWKPVLLRMIWVIFYIKLTHRKMADLLSFYTVVEAEKIRML